MVVLLGRVPSAGVGGGGKKGKGTSVV